MEEKREDSGIEENWERNWDEIREGIIHWEEDGERWRYLIIKKRLNSIKQ